MTRTPSPQPTEGLGATPLTAEERVQAVLDEWGYDDVARSPTFIASLIDAARLSVPSEALAEAAGYLADAAKHLADHVTEAKFYCEDTDNVQHFAAKVRAILAALPNREDAPEPPGTSRTLAILRAELASFAEPYDKPDDPYQRGKQYGLALAIGAIDSIVVREDAPSREGLAAVVAAVVADLGQSDGLHQYDRGIHRMPGCAACSLRARLAAALAATPPGGREDEADRERRRFREELDREEDVRGALHPVICDHEHNPATSPEHWRCVIAAHTAVAAYAEEAAGATAEAAAGEEGS